MNPKLKGPVLVDEKAFKEGLREHLSNAHPLQPPPPASGLPVTPCRAEELAVQLLSGTRRIEIHTEAAALLRAQQAELLALRAALKRIACTSDVAAWRKLGAEGSYAHFDEPASAQIAIAVLQLTPTQKSPAK